MNDPNVEGEVKCPNCMQQHESFPDVCMLGAAAGLVVERGSLEHLDTEKLRVALADFDVDAWWDHYMGPAVDALEEYVEEFYATTNDQPEGGEG